MRTPSSTYLFVLYIIYRNVKVANARQLLRQLSPWIDILLTHWDSFLRLPEEEKTFWSRHLDMIFLCCNIYRRSTNILWRWNFEKTLPRRHETQLWQGCCLVASWGGWVKCWEIWVNIKKGYWRSTKTSSKSPSFGFKSRKNLKTSPKGESSKMMVFTFYISKTSRI